ncbi:MULTISPECIES: hypothetical protein [Myxococcus]|uniref:hypothetical protein n=1 Tax=Myxococcus TaxID=32 RepID=UPI001595E502|nr:MULTISPECIES: hypothetical protein [Myxococcus]NVJ20042.1 hypothetical protein [Myxococcus sp. AM011]
MRRLGSALLCLSLLVGCGPTSPSEPSTPSEQPTTEVPANQDASLTLTNVDVAPECQGILTFANTAAPGTLDAYLPSDLVLNLVSSRSTAPFATLAQLSAVHLMGPVRLTQLESGARANGLINSSCVGILDELAVSTDDAAAVVSLVNTVSSSALYAILPYAWNGATNLLALRPFTSVQAISNTSGIGAVSLRNLRNAANLGYALEVLVSSVNALPEGNWTVKMDLAFDIQSVMNGEYGNDRLAYAQCFGIDPATFPNNRFTNRPNLADATEVHNYVSSAANTYAYQGQIPTSVINDGLDDLDARTAGGTFKGCHIGYNDGPWAGIQVHFFVNATTGFRILTVQHWVE